ncbi:MAG: Soluble cytochrome b558 [Accumulibacter sp.]|jgi:cytochrome b involved in lipid metabolism|uniref:cytochrome b5 domain-containing protein n=1 Tax=Accumulibacter sp. TaxID=2053492 RepID=UPI0012212262|nr:MAG: cytochrome b5 domain-containing protein [Candidatus Accumulibacter similis]TLD45026.1 MAG: Soluble cytochrome b558 [Accumulibacter sp.]
MLRLYACTTVVFWLLVATVAIVGHWAPAADPGNPPAAERLIPVAELARHSLPDDCWMAIRGAVHDVSTYLPDHPSRPGVVVPWCGREATEAYETKTRGRPHSAQADELLARYRIGRLADEQP